MAVLIILKSSQLAIMDDMMMLLGLTDITVGKEKQGDSTLNKSLFDRKYIILLTNWDTVNRFSYLL